MPLGSKIFDGTVDGVAVPPVRLFAEMKETSDVDELVVLDLKKKPTRVVAATHERSGVADGRPRVDFFVLTSPVGCTYTKFVPTNVRCVFVCREMVCVWHVVKQQIQIWSVCTPRGPNKTYILLVAPGIGKSIGCRSYQPYELLHYKVAKVTAVAYFVRGSEYILHKTGAMAGQAVYYAAAGEDTSANNEMPPENMKIKEDQRISGKKDGFIIFDVSGAFVPYLQFLLCRWTCIVLSSPNTKNFEYWKKQNSALPIYINCYSRREIMAFHAFQERYALRTDEEYIGAREQIELNWTDIRTRILEVGPLPHYIFDKEVFDDRREEGKEAVRSITKSDMER
ncbi:hypothetical protein, conserved in T. vivax, partial [Trypanosoma vivax Y486]